MWTPYQVKCRLLRFYDYIIVRFDLRRFCFVPYLVCLNVLDVSWVGGFGEISILGTQECTRFLQEILSLIDLVTIKRLV